jgi:hypothetical protein
MCHIYNTIGSLTYLKTYLDEAGIHDLRSVKALTDFQDHYRFYTQNILQKHEVLIKEEQANLILDIKSLKEDLNEHIQTLENDYTSKLNQLRDDLHQLSSVNPENSLQKLKNKLNQWSIKIKITKLEKDQNQLTHKITHDLNLKIEKNQQLLDFISEHKQEAVKQSADYELKEAKRINDVIDEVKPYIYGAIGEQKVVKTLETLSDDYYLINDFTVKFSKALYNSKEDDYINTIQIDHILVGPPGIFLIETKNWSERSLENLSLRSPVDQIKRTNYALFMLLHHEASKFRINLNHHWGDLRISIKNLLVLIQHKPNVEFQYVKVLKLDELLGYIGYAKANYSAPEVKKITDTLLRINNRVVHGLQ